MENHIRKNLTRDIVEKAAAEYIGRKLSQNIYY